MLSSFAKCSATSSGLFIPSVLILKYLTTMMKLIILEKLEKELMIVGGRRSISQEHWGKQLT
jgi:hypothetical protein